MIWNENLKKQIIICFGFQHSVSEQFQTHLEEEFKTRGGCPSDWLWLNPSQSGSLTSLFHQEMLHYHLSPSFESQVRFKSLPQQLIFSLIL